MAEAQRVGRRRRRQGAEAVGLQVVAEQLERRRVVLADDDRRGAARPAAAPGSRRPRLGGGQLQHRLGAALEGDPTGRHARGEARPAAGRRRGRRGRAGTACRRCGRCGSPGSAGPSPARAAVEQREAEEPGAPRAARPGPGARRPPPGAGRGSGAAGCVAVRLTTRYNPAARSRRPSVRGRAAAAVQTVVQASPRPHTGRRHGRRFESSGPPRTWVDRVREEEALEKATRRGNYDSGSDYVLEYGELRFSFNEQDFAQRVEQAAVKLDFVDGGLGAEELQDLLELAVNGEIARAHLLARRAHQRALDGAGRPGEPQPRALDPPARLPRRLARPAGQGGRARRGLRPRHPDLRLRSARARRRADRALPRALLGSPRLPALAEARPEQLGVRRRALDPLAKQASPPRPASRSASSERSRRTAASSSGARSSSSLETRHSPARSAGNDAGRGQLGVERDQRALGRDHRALGGAIVLGALDHGRDHGQRARPLLGQVAPGAEQALDLGGVARRRPRAATASRRSARRPRPPRPAAAPARGPARRRRTCSAGASSAVAAAISASGSASRQAVASSGRSSISSTTSSGPSTPRDRRREAAQERRAARSAGPP